MLKYFLTMAVFGFGSLSSLTYADELSKYCQQEFLENKVCPENVCHLNCQDSSDEEECIDRCIPLNCLEIEAEYCPEFACRMLKGCGGENVCYPLSEYETPQCGALAYEGQEVECCEGFIKRCGIEFFDGSCDMTGEYSLESVSMCVPCGNGICNQFENRCNCPEDCDVNYQAPATEEFSEPPAD